jgi:pilus assembly protein CpaE
MPATRHFVLNRADARVGIEVADVRAALGREVDASIPSSRSVPLAMNQGRPFVVDDPSSPAAREIARLAGRFVEGPAPASEPSGEPPGSGGRHAKGDTASRRRRRRNQK